MPEAVAERDELAIHAWPVLRAPCEERAGQENRSVTELEIVHRTLQPP